MNYELTEISLKGLADGFAHWVQSVQICPDCGNAYLNGIEGGSGGAECDSCFTKKREAEQMKKYKFEITQTNTYEVTIEAEDEEQALAEYNSLIVEDFGAPVDSRLEYEIEEESK